MHRHPARSNTVKWLNNGIAVAQFLGNSGTRPSGKPSQPGILIKPGFGIHHEYREPYIIIQYETQQ